MSVVAIADKGNLCMRRICIWKNSLWGRAAGKVHLDAPIEETLKIVAEAKQAGTGLCCDYPERDRHKELMKACAGQGQSQVDWRRGRWFSYLRPLMMGY